jgi:hypothetical protein
MDLQEIGKSLQLLWDAKPTSVVLLVVGVVLFVLLVVDTWRHRRKHRHRRLP